MTITREQVADLQPGDVVQLQDEAWPLNTTVTGPLWLDDYGALRCGSSLVRGATGVPNGGARRFLTVVSRAPRRLYVNHDRTEPVYGDVARNANPNYDDDATTWHYLPLPSRFANFLTVTSKGEPIAVSRADLPVELRLLVDGETGQVVQ